MKILTLFLIVVTIIVLYLLCTDKDSKNKIGNRNNRSTCWSGKSQDKLECCVGYSRNMDLEQIKKYYVDNGYSEDNIGGNYWECKDSSDSAAWWNDCNSYWNKNWTESCNHTPVEW